MSLEYLEVPESKEVLKNNLIGPCQRDKLERALNGQNCNEISNVVLDYNLKYKLFTVLIK